VISQGSGRPKMRL